MSRIIPVILFVIFLTGCTTSSSIGYTKIDKPTLVIPSMKPIKLNDVKFGHDGELYTLDDDNFDNLVRNEELIKNRLIIQDKIIKEYRDFY